MMDDMLQYIVPIVTAVLGYIGGRFHDRSNQKVKYMEIYDTRRLDAIENYLKNADMCISNCRQYSMFSDCSSTVLIYMNRPQAETAIRINEHIRNYRFDEARSDLNALSLQLQNSEGCFARLVRAVKRIDKKR